MGKAPGRLRVPETRQLNIIHLSDIHFGEHHRFSQLQPIGPGKLPATGRPSLADTLLQDLRDVPDPKCPVIICITGDLAEKAISDEFREAERFIKDLADKPILGQPRTLNNIFIVPGNHDLAYGNKHSEDRWTPWAKFCNDTFGTTFAPRESASRISFHDRVSDLGAIIVCLNSSEYVEKDTPEAMRGVVDVEQLDALSDFLKKIPTERLESAIRIALIHHHPVLIPGLAEPGRGYDAVEGAGFLLHELRTFGFHLILHGHKHTPYHFSEDSYTAFHENKRPPIVIVAGGSASSIKVQAEHGFNCYNRLTLKWNPEAKQGRILLSTRALKTSEKGAPLRPSQWEWKPRLIDDRQYLNGPSAPQTFAAKNRKFETKADKANEARRNKHYTDLRYNLPVCHVLPSLYPEQHNEVRLWIEFHKSSRTIRGKTDRPVQVTWSCGDWNSVVTVRRNRDSRFCATLHYWGPMLVQAKLEFKDGHVAYGYVYARMPTVYPRPDGAIDIG
jgi:3',5'-cyclic AMP phosphodiesterase CpdA